MADQKGTTIHFYSFLIVFICMPTGTQWDEISDLQHIIMNIITCKKINLNKLWLRKKQFASLVGMLWITCLYHRQPISLIGSKLKSTQYLTYSQIRSNIISNTKNNYIQLSFKYSFKKQSDLWHLIFHNYQNHPMIPAVAHSALYGTSYTGTDNSLFGCIDMVFLHYECSYAGQEYS